MPANKKYLIKSPWLRLARLLVGVLGGYVLMLSVHLCLSLFFPANAFVITAYLTGYLMWVFLLLWAYTAKSLGFLVLLYLGLSVLFSGIYYVVAIGFHG
ncbi:hypothetical protein ACL9RF_05900 [Sphingobacterium sp. Mn56C]|uniref:hypothetical protein n=1 Tax=Sphingobacterium sp. Mn56C TaxID=3395261 RepID=UPI003BD2A8F5